MLRNRMNKYFVFDRDNTLVDKSFNLINPQEICQIIQEIDSSEDCAWAIASAGALDLKSDPGYQAVKSQVDLNHEPHYVAYNQAATLAVNLESVNGSVFFNNYNSSNLTLKEKAQLVFHVLMSSLNFKFEEYIPIPNTSGEIWIEDNLSFMIRFNNICISIRADKFHENLRFFAEGDFKLFAVIMALDQANLILDPSTQPLGRMGIYFDMISDCQLIDPRDVVFVDDKVSNCAVLRQAGFTVIEADTVFSKSKKNEGSESVKNTYLAKLNDIISLNSLMSDLGNYSDFLSNDSRIHAFRVINKGYVLANFVSELRSCSNDIQSLKDKLDDFYAGKNIPGSDYEVLNRGQGITTRLFGLDTTTLKKINSLRDFVDSKLESSVRMKPHTF